MELFDLETLIKTAGYVGVFGIVFAESGLLIGFFLPGDSLLFTAGFLASQGFLNIVILAVGSCIAAVVGDSVGYFFGKKVGPAVFKKEDSLFFNKKYIQSSQEFYNKHGGKTIILARFVPVVRTFAPILAGVGQMHYAKFFSYNVIGGILWGLGVTLLGYFLGSAIPNVDKYLLPIIAVIVILSILPGVVHVLRDPAARQAFVFHTRKFWKNSSKGADVRDKE